MSKDYFLSASVKVCNSPMSCRMACAPGVPHCRNQAYEGLPQVKVYIRLAFVSLWYWLPLFASEGLAGIKFPLNRKGRGREEMSISFIVFHCQVYCTWQDEMVDTRGISAMILFWIVMHGVNNLINERHFWFYSKRQPAAK